MNSTEIYFNDFIDQIIGELYKRPLQYSSYLEHKVSSYRDFIIEYGELTLSNGQFLLNYANIFDIYDSFYPTYNTLTNVEIIIIKRNHNQKKYINTKYLEMLKNTNIKPMTIFFQEYPALFDELKDKLDSIPFVPLFK